MACSPTTTARKKARTPVNPLVGPLLTDFYQISMAYTYWKHGRHERPAVFELYFRKNPFGGEFTIFGGLEECLCYVENFKVTDDDVEYLRTLLPRAEDEFFEWIRSVDCSKVQIYAVREGTVVFPKRAAASRGAAAGCARPEPTLVAQVPAPPHPRPARDRAAPRDDAAEPRQLRVARHDERGAHAPGRGPRQEAARVRPAARPGPRRRRVREPLRVPGRLRRHVERPRGPPLPGPAGLGHAQPRLRPELHHGRRARRRRRPRRREPRRGRADLAAAPRLRGRGARIGVVLSSTTSDPKTTRSLHAGEFAAFVAYALANPTNFVALVDTYSTLETGLKNFVTVALALKECGFAPKGVRIDSGDLAYLSRESRALFAGVVDAFRGTRHEATAACLEAVSIVASNDINETVLLSLKEQGHAIDCYGIGTHLVTCQAQPALGCVYKLVEIDGEPCIKLSNEIAKTTIPGAKSIYRLVSSADVMLLDLLVPFSHAPPEVGERILCRHPFDHQKRAYVTPSKVLDLHQLVFDGTRCDPDRSLIDIRDHCLEQLRTVREDILRPLNPTPYKTSVTPALFTFFQEIWQRNEPVRELS